MNIEIRKANINDTKDIADVNLNTWCISYKGIVPDEMIKKRLNQRDNYIKRLENRINNGELFYVAVFDDRIVGMMSIGESTNNDYPNVGEILTLYLLNEYHGLGIGKKLLRYGFRELVKLGYQNAIICCLKENPTCKFYEHMGGVKVGKTFFEKFNYKLEENIYFYKDIKKY